MDFLPVTPATLRAHWANISASLDAILQKAPEDWIKEDVYHAIKSGNAACVIGLDNGGYAGVMVVVQRVAEFSGERSLHVWIAHNLGERDVLQEGIQMVRDLAAQSGIAKVTFGSPRVGWAKRHKLVYALYEIGAGE